MASVVFFLLWSKAFPFQLVLLNSDCLDIARHADLIHNFSYIYIFFKNK
jgi:hypothetical protein